MSNFHFSNNNDDILDHENGGGEENMKMRDLFMIFFFKLKIFFRKGKERGDERKKLRVSFFFLIWGHLLLFTIFLKKLKLYFKKD